MSQLVIETLGDLLNYLSVLYWEPSKPDLSRLEPTDKIESLRLTYKLNTAHFINVLAVDSPEKWVFTIYGPTIVPSRCIDIDQVKKYMEKITYRE